MQFIVKFKKSYNLYTITYIQILSSSCQSLHLISKNIKNKKISRTINDYNIYPYKMILLDNNRKFYQN